MDALLRLLRDKETSCRFYSIITGERAQEEPYQAIDDIAQAGESESPASGRLNESQKAAVASCSAPLSLIWGPPGR